MKTTLTILAMTLLPFMVQAQSIEKFSIDSGGASVSAEGIQMLYTIGEVNVQELSTESISVSEGFINSDFKIKVDPKLFLQGPILNPAIAGLMNDNLRQNALIPTTSPYADAATCNASVFSVTGNNAIVDWVWVELKAADDNSKLINGKSALLQRDGDVVGLDGSSGLLMSAAPTNYFIVVKHRNHLGAMSAATITFNESTPTAVDFTNSGFPTSGDFAQAQLASNDMALWAGDVNGNGQTRYLGPGNDTNIIKERVLNPINGNPSGSNFYPYNGYDTADIDMNATVRYLGPNNDTSILKAIILSHPDNGSLSNFFPIFAQIIN